MTQALRNCEKKSSDFSSPASVLHKISPSSQKQQHQLQLKLQLQRQIKKSDRSVTRHVAKKPKSNPLHNTQITFNLNLKY